MEGGEDEGDKHQARRICSICNQATKGKPKDNPFLSRASRRRRRDCPMRAGRSAATGARVRAKSREFHSSCDLGYTSLCPKLTQTEERPLDLGPRALVRNALLSMAVAAAAAAAAAAVVVEV